MTEISMHAPGLVERDFRVGRVFNRAASVLSRNFVPFMAIAAVAALPNLSQIIGVRPLGIALGYGRLTQSTVIFLVFGLILLGLVLFSVSQAAILNAAYQDMCGRPSPIGESLRKGLQRFLPVIGLALLQALGTTLAYMLLFVPGLIVMSMWFVALPACVVERLGPWASLKRSSGLTAGHRWKIFGIIALLILVNSLGSAFIGAVFGMFRLAHLSLIFGVTFWIWAALLGAFQATVAVVAYYELRAAKEGIDIEQIVAVFD